MGSFLSLSQKPETTLANPNLHLAPSPAQVSLRDGSKLSLGEFLETRCPSALKVFKPSWWLFNGHFQTAYCVLGDFSNIDKVTYDRTLIRTPDGGTIGLDFTGPGPQDELDPETTIVVVMHGLTGGSYESYVRSIISTACSSRENGGLGYRGVVVNFRGCAGVEITSPQFYSAGHTEDLRTALFYLSLKYPKARKLGLGFSLGAGVVTRYLGEEGFNSKLASGCALACPWDINKNSENLENRWFHRTVYSKAMGRNLKKLFLNHLKVLEKMASPVLLRQVELLKQMQDPRLIDVDELMTRFVGGSSPPFPFPNVHAYYEWASSHHHISSIKVPFFAISDLDDPIVKDIPFPVSNEASYTAILTTKSGGHLGWFQRRKDGGMWEVDRWYKAPVYEWLKATGEDLMVEAGKEDAIETVDGFTRMVENPKIGFKEAGTSKLVADQGATGVLAGL